MGAQAVEIFRYLHKEPALGSAGQHYYSPAARHARFTMIGRKFTYSSNRKFAYRAHCLDRRMACLNPVTNRQYSLGDNSVIHKRSGQSGRVMNTMLASSAAKNGMLTFDNAPTSDSVEGRPANKSSAYTRQRRRTLAALGKTVFVSAKTLNHVPLDRFAAAAALSFSDLEGQKEYHAEF